MAVWLEGWLLLVQGRWLRGESVRWSLRALLSGRIHWQVTICLFCDAHNIHLTSSQGGATSPGSGHSVPRSEGLRDSLAHLIHSAAESLTHELSLGVLLCTFHIQVWGMSQQGFRPQQHQPPSPASPTGIKSFPGSSAHGEPVSFSGHWPYIRSQTAEEADSLGQLNNPHSGVIAPSSHGHHCTSPSIKPAHIFLVPSRELGGRQEEAGINRLSCSFSSSTLEPG